MNWRQLVLNHAAHVLRTIGEDELAQKVQCVDVPLIDGGCCIHFGVACRDGYHVDSESWQSVDPSETRHVFLLLR